MNTLVKRILTYGALPLMFVLILSVSGAFTVSAKAALDSAPMSETTIVDDEGTQPAKDNEKAGKAIGAGIAIGLSAALGALAMGIAIAKSAEGIARQPESESKVRSNLMIGLVFIETAIIYALIVSILIIFVL